MKKVIYLIDTLEVGGAETSILEIASRLKEWTPLVVSIYKGNTLKEHFAEADIKVYSLEISQKFGVKEGRRELMKIVEQEKPDLIHATLFRAEQYSRWLGVKYKIPVLNSFVNDSYSQERYSTLNLKEKFALNVYKWIDRFTAHRVDKFMSITRAIIPANADALKINPENVEVIYRGRNIKAFHRKAELAEKMDIIPQDGPVLLTVSRLLKRKGYQEAIRAIGKVVEKVPELTYLIAGEGHDRSDFERLIKELGLEENVILLGNRKDVPALLKHSDFFLFPSHYEGQGGALVEAMIMGKPIIASRIPVIEESVKDQYSALLFDLKDVNDLAHKILWALDNPKTMNEFGGNAQKEAENRFDISQVAEKHEKLYDEILETYHKK